MTAKPGVGDTVHYVSHGSPDGTYKAECRAAIVAAAPAAGRGRPSKKLELMVINPSGVFFKPCIQDEDTKAGGTWHFPEVEVEKSAAPKVVKAAE